MGGSAPDTTDWKGLQAGITGAAGRQVANNRLNTSNPFASQTFNEDGSTSTRFEGGLGSAADGLQRQAGQLGQPMDWSQFSKAGTGDQARDSAINAAYGQFESRANPMWDRREEQARTRLLNQGLDPTSEAFKNSMGDLSSQRTDAYNQGMFSAIGQGTAAGDSAFRNNLMGRQSEIADALRQRGQPLSEMQQMMSLTGQPQYGQDNTTLAGAMGSAGMAKSAADQKRAKDEADAAGSANTAGAVMSGIGSAAAIAAMFF
jgi:hypothetical protein